MLLEHSAEVNSRNLNKIPLSRMTWRWTNFIFSLSFLVLILCRPNPGSLLTIEFDAAEPPSTRPPYLSVSPLCPLLSHSPPFLRAIPSLSQYLEKPHNPTDQRHASTTRRRPRGMAVARSYQVPILAEECMGCLPLTGSSWLPTTIRYSPHVRG